MSPHRGQDETIWRIYVPTQPGGWKIRSTGTEHRGTALAMQRMVDALGPRGTRDWELLGAVAAKRLSLGRLYDAYRVNGLDALRSRLADVDLAPWLPRWSAWLADHVRPATVEHYRSQLVTLHHGKPWLRSSLTPDTVQRWLAGLKVAGPTKRVYYASLASFLHYVRSLGVDPGDPLRTVTPPPRRQPRTVHLDLPDVWRVVGAAEEPYRSLFALLYGTAMDVSTAIRLTRRAVDLEAREIRAAGTKSHTRDRICGVAEWAWPYVQELCRGKLPDAPLFPDMDRTKPSDLHRAIVTRLGLRGVGRDAIRLHDARHHWAVRAIRAGTPIELVARQLGHADGTMALKVYGRFVPRSDERRKWELEATKADQKGVG